MDSKSSKYFKDIPSYNNIPKIEYEKMEYKPQINLRKRHARN